MELLGEQAYYYLCAQLRFSRSYFTCGFTLQAAISLTIRSWYSLAVAAASVILGDRKLDPACWFINCILDPFVQLYSAFSG